MYVKVALQFTMVGGWRWPLSCACIAMFLEIDDVATIDSAMVEFKRVHSMRICHTISSPKLANN